MKINSKAVYVPGGSEDISEIQEKLLTLATKEEIVQGIFEFGTYVEFDAYKSNLPLNCTVVIGEENNTGTGAWRIGNNRWDGTTLTKSTFDPVTTAKLYTDKLEKWSHGNSKNLFDSLEAITGSIVTSSNGTLATSASSQYVTIAVQPNTVYTLSGIGEHSANTKDRMALVLLTASEGRSKPLKADGSEYALFSLTESDTTTNGGIGTFKTRADTAYVRFTCKYGSAAVYPQLQLELGSTATAYEKHKPRQISEDRLLDFKASIETKIPSFITSDFSIIGDGTLDNVGDYITGTTTAYSVAHMLDVVPLSEVKITYYSQSTTGVAAYDKNMQFKSFIDYGSGASKTVTLTPDADTYYISVVNLKTHTAFAIEREITSNNQSELITGITYKDNFQILPANGWEGAKTGTKASDFIAVKKDEVLAIDLSQVLNVSAAVIYQYNEVKLPVAVLKTNKSGVMYVKALQDGFIRYSTLMTNPTSVKRIKDITTATQLSNIDSLKNSTLIQKVELDNKADLATQFDEYMKQRKNASLEIVSAMRSMDVEPKWYGYQYVEKYAGTEQDIRIASSEEAMQLHATLPIQNKMRRCVCDRYTGEVIYYLDSNNSALKANGKPAVLDGTDGNVMVEIPDFYYKCEREAVTIGGATYTKVILKISEFCIDSDWVYSRKCYTSAFEATIDRTRNILASVCSANFTFADQEVITSSESNYTKANSGFSHGTQKTSVISGFKANAVQYRGGTNNSAYDATTVGHADFERNQLGRPLANMNRYEVNQYRPSKSMTCHKYDTLIALTVLYIVEYATTDAQKPFMSNNASGYKQGGTGMGSTVYPSYEAFEKFWAPQGGITVLPNGSTICLGNNTGQVFYKMTNVPLDVSLSSRGDVWMPILSYRGVEQFYGHAYKIIDQANFWTYLDDNDVKVSEFWYQPNPYRLSDVNIDGYKYMGNQFTVQHAVGEGTFVEEMVFTEDNNMYSVIAKSAKATLDDGTKYGGDFAENLLHNATKTPQVYYQTFNGRIVSGSIVGLFFSCALYPAVGQIKRTSDTTRLDHY